MNAGLPGTGIGGVFYLLSALWMPFRELYTSIREKRTPQHTPLIVVQVSLAFGIIAGIWLTGWLLGELLVAAREWLALQQWTVAPPPGHVPNLIRITMIFLTIGLLVVVVSGVHVLKLVMRHHKLRHASNSRVRLPTIIDARLRFGEMSHSHSRDVVAEKVEVST